MMTIYDLRFSVLNTSTIKTDCAPLSPLYGSRCKIKQKQLYHFQGSILNCIHNQLCVTLKMVIRRHGVALLAATYSFHLFYFFFHFIISYWIRNYCPPHKWNLIYHQFYMPIYITFSFQYLPFTKTRRCHMLFKGDTVPAFKPVRFNQGDCRQML